MAKSKPTAGKATSRERAGKSKEGASETSIDVSAKFAEGTVEEEKPLPPAPAPATQSPYRLDKAQTLKAARALLTHLSTAPADPASKQNLLHDPEDPSDTAVPIWLIVATKKYLTDTRKLKLKPIPLPHQIRPAGTTICLIVKDPQRHFKDLVAAAGLQATVTKVVSIGKIRKKFKAFEARRQLRDSHDMFLADDRVASMLPAALGSSFFRGSTSKIPSLVSLPGTGCSAEHLKKQIRKALQNTHVRLSPAASTSIHVALSTFAPEQVAENVDKAVTALAERTIPGGFKNIKSVHIKGSSSASLPIYMAGELYGDEDVLKPEDEKERLLAVAKKVATRKESGDSRKRKRPSNSKPAEDPTETPKKKKKKAKVAS